MQVRAFERYIPLILCRLGQNRSCAPQIKVSGHFLQLQTLKQNSHSEYWHFKFHQMLVFPVDFL